MSGASGHSCITGREPIEMTTRERLRAASKRMWADPVIRARIMQARGGYKKREAVCARCGTSFRKYQTKTTVLDYCSRECQVADRTGQRNPKWRGGTMQSLTCKKCGAAFQRQRAALKRNRGQFCSWACKSDSIRIYATLAEGRRESGRRYEQRKRAARAIKHHTRAEWVALLAKHGGKCARCGSIDRIERDHIIPISRGGDDSIENIQPLCKRCNCSKHNKIEAPR